MKKYVVIFLIYVFTWQIKYLTKEAHSPRAVAAVAFVSHDQFYARFPFSIF
jgi:hypothetical protein